MEMVVEQHEWASSMTDTATNDKDGPFHVHVFPQLLEVGKRLGISVSSV